MIQGQNIRFQAETHMSGRTIRVDAQFLKTGKMKNGYVWTRSKYSRTPVTRTLKGNEKQFELARFRVIGVD